MRFILFLQNALQFFLISFAMNFLEACTSIPAQSLALVDGAPEELVLETVPYRVDPVGRMIISAKVNNTGPYDFIIDTAASRTLIFENVRQKLDLSFLEEETTFVHGAVLSRERPVLPIALVEVGSLRLENIKSFSLPDMITTGSTPGGVIGIDFLSRYALFVNVAEKRITFAKSGYRPPRSQFISVPITFDTLDILDYGIPFIPVSVQGRKINEALFDLGASSNIANWAAVKNFGINYRRFLRDKYNFQGIFGDITIAAYASNVEISIGGRVWRGERIDVSNLLIFETLKRTEIPTLIISADLLRSENLIIDFPAKRLYLEANRDQRRRVKRSNCIAQENVFINCSS